MPEDSEIFSRKFRQDTIPKQTVGKLKIPPPPFTTHYFPTITLTISYNRFYFTIYEVTFATDRHF